MTYADISFKGMLKQRRIFTVKKNICHKVEEVKRKEEERKKRRRRKEERKKLIRPRTEGSIRLMGISKNFSF
jgi:hypothetical protein